MRTQSGNGIAIILVAVAFAIIGFFGGKFIGGNKSDAKEIAKDFSNIRYQKNLVLSTRNFDKLVFVEREDRYASKLKLLINIPASMYAEFDLTSLNFSVEKDNIIIVDLPDLVIKGPFFNLQDAENIDIYKNLGLAYSNAAYPDVFTQFQKEINDQIASIRSEEIIEEMRKEALSNLVLYLQSYAAALECSIMFKDAP